MFPSPPRSINVMPWPGVRTLFWPAMPRPADPRRWPAGWRPSVRGRRTWQRSASPETTSPPGPCSGHILPGPCTTTNTEHYFYTVLWIYEILVRYGCGSVSANPYIWLMDPDADPAFFSVTFKTSTKKFFCFLLFKVLTSFVKDKSRKEVTKQ